MASLDYLNVPSSATRLLSNSDANNVQPVPIIKASLPLPVDEPVPDISEPVTPPLSPSKTLNPFANILISSALPSGIQGTSRSSVEPLLSTKEPLSIGVTTVNFKAFVARVGPVFWLQDRLEEIFLWKKGWKWTTIWLLLYCSLCYFPRLLLCVPHVTLIAIMTYNRAAVSDVPREGSVEWANIQAIQNLMGFYSEMHDIVYPWTSFLTHKSTYSPHILTLLVVTLLPVLFLVTTPYFPVRQVALSVGVLPILLAHPNIRPLLQHLAKRVRSPEFFAHASLALHRARSSKLISWIVPTIGWTGEAPKTWTSFIQLVVDNNSLADTVWNSEIRELELFENERLDPALSSDNSTVTHDRIKGFRKSHLRPGERSAWTRRRDGWGNISSVNFSTSTFSLPEHWYFVDTEDWRADVDALWASCGGDANGWVYTNDSWLDAKPYPHGSAVTRRRRWVRRVWYNPPRQPRQ